MHSMAVPFNLLSVPLQMMYWLGRIKDARKQVTSMIIFQNPYFFRGTETRALKAIYFLDGLFLCDIIF